MNYILRLFKTGLAAMLLQVVIPALLLAQSSPGSRPPSSTFPPIPPSPTAASLGRFGDAPVSMYSGGVSTAVPLYTIQVGEFSLPISLVYSSTGCRVSEISSWVGSGWSLQGAGVVTRSIRGKADEASYGNDRLGSGLPVVSSALSTASTIADYNILADNIYRAPHVLSNDYAQFREGLAQGQLDGLPDLFYYNFAGRSGQLMVGQSAVQAMPYAPLQIARVNGYKAWRIVDEQGNVFVFGDESSTGPSTVEKTTSRTFSNNSASETSEQSISTWNLTRITTSQGQVISFTYENESITYPTSYTETFYSYLDSEMRDCQQAGQQPSCEVPTRQFNYSDVQIETKRLKRITFPTGSVEFVAPTPRLDVSAELTNRVNRLDSVNIKDRFGRTARSFALSYYYRGPGNPLQRNVDNRMFLQSVQETNSVNRNPAYSFTYNHNTPEPCYSSTSQDHWGYYNGKSNSTTLIPSVIGSSYDQYFTTSFTDRSSDLASTLYGVLEKVKYPTGGFTTFNYELNDYRFFKKRNCLLFTIKYHPAVMPR